jgi:hypothetical protein
MPTLWDLLRDAGNFPLPAVLTRTVCARNHTYIYPGTHVEILDAHWHQWADGDELLCTVLSPAGTFICPPEALKLRKGK